MPRLSYLDKALAIGKVEAGVPENQVAALFGVSPGTISKLKAKFCQTGDVKDRPRSGRPRKTTPQEDRFITRTVLRNRRLSSRDLQARFAGRYGIQISDQTVRNRLHAANLRAYKATRKPAITALHRQAHLRWCQQHRKWNRNMWGNVMFSDESRFCLPKLDGRNKVWRRRGECYESYADCCNDLVTAFGGGSIMAWGGISIAGKTRLVIIKGHLNAVKYRDEILQPVAIPYLHNLGSNSILQDDIHHPHRARVITDYLQNVGVERMEWPAMSPDLNPIEHLWDQLGRVSNTTTLADLQRLLVEEWNAIPQQRVTRLVTGMRKRCQAVVAAYGSSTCY